MLKRVYIRAINLYQKKGAIRLLVGVKDFIKYSRPVQIVVALLYWLSKGKLLRKSTSGWLLHDLRSNTRVYFPHINDHKRFKQSHIDNIERKYYDNEITVDEGDIVFDVGAYIGITTFIPATDAQHVYAVEPSPRARRCLEKNVSQYNNVTIIQEAAWNKSEELELQFGREANEDGLIEPDDGGISQTVSVQGLQIAAMAEKYGVDKIDFLKVEAEGVEPEIIEGIEGIPVSKIASSGNAERWGQTVYAEVSSILEEYDYSISISKKTKMIYAWSKEYDRYKGD